MSKTVPGLLTGAYTCASNTHHLMGIGTSTRQVDAGGNTRADVLASGAYGYGYDGRNRLAVGQNNGVKVGAYVLNGLGLRVQKSANLPEFFMRMSMTIIIHIINSTHNRQAGPMT